MRHKTSWDDLKFFLSFVRSGTMRAAAQMLGVSHSTVARRLEKIEQNSGVRLFDKHPSRFVLTLDGEDMLRVAETIEKEIFGLERRITGKDQKLDGVIRLTTVDFLATHFLMPCIADFSKQYPNIDIDIIITYDTLNLDAREADMTLRFGANPPDHLVGRRFMTMLTAAYASKEYVLANDIENPKSAQWIGFRDKKSNAEWGQRSPFPHLPVRGNFQSLLVQLEACKQGIGLAMLPVIMGDNTPGLRRLSLPERDPVFDVWALTHRDLRTTARLQALSDHLYRFIKRKKREIEGIE